MTAHFALRTTLQDIGANEITLSALDGNIRVKTYERGEVILRQGDRSPNVLFLTSGLVKLVYLTADGREFIKSFLDKGHIMGSLVSVLEQKGSTFSLVCLEPSTVESLPYTLLQQLVDRDVALLRFMCSVFQQIALKKESREYDFLCLSPAQRYKKFLMENTSVRNRVTEAEIARYLGITPVALSRIKARLNQVESHDKKIGSQ